jgi:hypothetical protein
VGRGAWGAGRFAVAGVRFANLPPVRALRSLLIAAVLVAGVAVPAAAQTSTTTTMPPVRSIPVTPAPTTTAAPAATTTTTARPATSAGGEVAAAGDEDPLADTGIAADKLVPLGFALIALGALLDAAARRARRRTAYSFF